jgi:hypothetical protein
MLFVFSAAERDETMDSLIKRLLRDERARRMGAALAERRTQMSVDSIETKRALIAGSTSAANHALR